MVGKTTITMGTIMTTEEFEQVFSNKQIPHELSLLLVFQQRYGGYTYSNGFSLSNSGRKLIKDWSVDETFLNQLIPFAKANDQGAVYACWDDGTNKPFNKMPVLVFGDEGGVHVVAHNIIEILQLLTCDKKLSVSHGKLTFKNELRESTYSQAYKDWVKEKFDIAPISNPYSIIENAQHTFKGSFDGWFMQYHNSISEKEAKERFQLAEYIENLHGDDYRYLLLEGDIVTEGFYYSENYGVIVNGNLTIKDDLFETDSQYGQTLFVTGNLQAKNLVNGGGEWYIKGNLIAEQTIYGFFDNGRLTVEGDTKAVTIFAEEHYFKFGGNVRGLLISIGEIEGAVARFNTTEPLLDELIDSDQQSSHDLVMQYINEGLPIIKEIYRG
jgi:hypothetical protein